MTSESILKIIFQTASQKGIPIVILGGLALPAYNVFRTTLDIDIAIKVSNQKQLDNFVSNLKEKGVKTRQNPKLDHDLFTVFGFKNEAEIWLKPCDAFEWDDKMVKNIKPYSENIYVLSLEDFIMSKLARSDRSSTDISDILQIFINNYREIDWDYLRFRLNWASVKNDLEQILKGPEAKINDELKTIMNNILDQLDME